MDQQAKAATKIQSLFKGFSIRRVTNKGIKKHYTFEKNLGLQCDVQQDQNGLLHYTQNNTVFDKAEEYLIVKQKLDNMIKSKK